MRLSARHYDQAYYEEHRREGLDYLGHGQWQLDYGKWLAECLGWAGKPILDVGCACGSIAAGLKAATEARVVGVDLCEHMVGLGRQQWPELELHTCDAVNLHLWPDGTFAGIHCAQVAEHWRPDHVPMIMQELRRVVERGALFFCALDTSELYARQGRQVETEDPTHICVRSKDWWGDTRFDRGPTWLYTAWAERSVQYEHALRTHPLSYLSRYDWDWWVWEAI